MKIVRATSPSGITLIEPLLIADNDRDRSAAADMFRQGLVNVPDAMFVLVAFEEEEVLGFVVAYLPPAVDHVFLHQAWVKPGVTTLADKLFIRLAIWTENAGRHFIRAETQRNPEAFLRRWNFTQVSVIMQHRLVDDIESSITHAAMVGTPTKEHSHGTEQSSDTAGSSAGNDSVKPDAGKHV